MKVPDLELSGERGGERGWYHVGRGWWLHTLAATIRLRHVDAVPMSYILGQGNAGAYAADFFGVPYQGFIVELRYCNEGWSYSLNYPLHEAGLNALITDCDDVGLPFLVGLVAEIRRDAGVLLRRRSK